MANETRHLPWWSAFLQGIESHWRVAQTTDMFSTFHMSRSHHVGNFSASERSALLFSDGFAILAQRPGFTGFVPGLSIEFLPTLKNRRVHLVTTTVIPASRYVFQIDWCGHMNWNPLRCRFRRSTDRGFRLTGGQGGDILTMNEMPPQKEIEIYFPPRSTIRGFGSCERR